MALKKTSNTLNPRCSPKPAPLGLFVPRPGVTSTCCGPILTCQCWVDRAGASEVLHRDGGDPEERPAETTSGQAGGTHIPIGPRGHTTVA